jgi:hypothetical protein
MSLCTELRSLMEARKQSFAPYFVALHRRLSPLGDILLNKVRTNLKALLDLSLNKLCTVHPKTPKNCGHSVWLKLVIRAATIKLCVPIGMLSLRVEIGVLLCLSVLSSRANHSDMMRYN